VGGGGLWGLVDVAGEMGRGWSAVVSWDVSRNILGNVVVVVRVTATRPPTHRRKRYLGLQLQVVHRKRSMYRGFEAQGREVASTGEDRCCVHFE
jgi:hypothetical protein